MNDIKITVEYEVPKMSAFDEMMVQYAAVKQSAEQTIAYFAPLADVAEEAKMMAILEQLANIADYLRKLNSIESHFMDFHVYPGGEKFTVKLDYNGKVYFKWRGVPFDLESRKRHPYCFNAERYDDYNILGKWDEWKVYEMLENRCLKELRRMIDEQAKAAQAEVKRLENITK